MQKVNYYFWNEVDVLKESVSSADHIQQRIPIECSPFNFIICFAALHADDKDNTQICKQTTTNQPLSSESRAQRLCFVYFANKWKKTKTKSNKNQMERIWNSLRVYFRDRMRKKEQKHWGESFMLWVGIHILSAAATLNMNMDSFINYDIFFAAILT